MRIDTPRLQTLIKAAASPPKALDLKLGQRLEVVVEQRRPAELLLNVLGERVRAGNPKELQLSAGQRLQVQVQQLNPQLTLKVLGDSPRAPAQRLAAALIPRQAPVADTIRSLPQPPPSQGVQPGAQQPSLPQPVQTLINRIAEGVGRSSDATDPTRLRALLELSGTGLERRLASASQQAAREIAGNDRQALLHRLASRIRAQLGQPRAAGQQAMPQQQQGAQQVIQDANLRGALEALLVRTEQAISRLQLLQLQPAVSDTDLDLAFELPLADGEDTDSLYLRVRREGGDERESADASQAPVYRLTVRLDFEQHGALQANVAVQGEQVSAVWHAEDARVAELVEGHLPELQARIEGLGLTAGRLSSVNARPPEAAGDVRRPRSGSLNETA